MQVTMKRFIRLLLVGGIAIAAVFVLCEYFGYDQLSPANAECLDGRGNCANTECVSSCWADGTQHHAHTFAKRTAKAPAECFPGDGCLTYSCP